MEVPRRVERFATEQGFAPVRLDVGWATDHGWTEEGYRSILRHLKGLFEGPWHGVMTTLYVTRYKGDEDHTDFINAGTTLEVRVGRIRFGHRWLVGPSTDELPQVDLGIPPPPAPRRWEDLAAASQQIVLRTSDERFAQGLGKTKLVPWFKRKDPVALGFTTSTPGFLEAVGGAGAWEKDLSGFLDALVEFRTLLTQAVQGWGVDLET